MTLVRMRIGISGYRDGVPWPPVGETIDLPDFEAQRMLHAGLVSIVEEVHGASGPGSDSDEAAAADDDEPASGDGGTAPPDTANWSEIGREDTDPTATEDSVEPVKRRGRPPKVREV